MFAKYSSTLQLGYWIVEALVDRQTEFYPRGGLSQLVSKSIDAMDVFLSNRSLVWQKRGLSQLKAVGIQAILDHHGLPGVQTANQQFTGR